MGRHFEVRAAAMAATAKKKSAVYMRASKEIYAAAKSGIPDPNSNLALRNAIQKYHKSVPKDVIERAIDKAKGGDAVAYIEGRYEFYGPGGSYIIVDTMSDNANRALVSVRTIVTRKGGKMGSVAYNFNHVGVLDFPGDESKRDEVEENLILGDVDVQSVTSEDGEVEVIVSPSDFDKAKGVLADLGITEFDSAETTLMANEDVELSEEDTQKVRDMLDQLDECEDVQNVYHNVANI